MSNIIALGYVGFEVSDIGRWERFAVDVVGAQLGTKDDHGGRALRVDERARRINLHPGSSDDLAYVGFEVADGSALRDLAKDLRAAGITVQEGSLQQCQQRAVEEMVLLTDPSGLCLEIFHHAEKAPAPFASSVLRSRFCTGLEGLGHVVVSTDKAEITEKFYRERLGFRITDRSASSFRPGQLLTLAFLRTNPRHHSIALVAPALPRRLHHLMLEVAEIEDVGIAYERFQNNGYPIISTLGQHPNDHTFSFYASTPSQFEIEISWGGRKIDEATWKEVSYDYFSIWGHRSGKLHESSPGSPQLPASAPAVT
jgi:2,3-dihydroxybiphenyl 1,2-dioxygenase